MAFGLVLFILGYVLFYWGAKHFGGCRYSLWCLMGMGIITKSGQVVPGSLSKNLNLPEGQPFKLSS